MNTKMSDQKFGRVSRNRAQFTTETKEPRFTKAPTHGHGASGLAWIGVGLFVFGIVLYAATGSPVASWVLAGIAVQCWMVSAIVRPIEAIWTLLNEKS